MPRPRISLMRGLLVAVARPFSAAAALGGTVELVADRRRRDDPTCKRLRTTLASLRRACQGRMTRARRDADLRHLLYCRRFMTPSANRRGRASSRRVRAPAVTLRDVARAANVAES